MSYNVLELIASSIQIKMNITLNFKLTNFGVRYLTKAIFSRTTSQVTISQVATSLVCNFTNRNFPKVSLATLRRHILQQWGPSAAARKLLLGKLHSWEVATWEKFFGKVPNILILSGPY